MAGAGDVFGIAITGDGVAGEKVLWTAGAAASDAWMMAFPFAVPSTPQTGHCTGPGSKPFTGSVSNLYLAPQSQKILISIIAL